MQIKPFHRSVSHLSLILIIFKVSLFSQVAVQINSGNPALPFPQFLAYDNPTQKLGNLATNNPVGVSHAEMESSIRDAYQIMMNRATKPGGGIGGIDYIYFRSTPSCTEGDGYAMLAAVAMADKATFDGLWLWVHDKAMNKVKRYSDCVESSPNYYYSRLPSWQNAAGTNSATDGDEDIGLALLCAYYQWGEFMGINDAYGNPISYKQEAVEFLKGMTDTLTFANSGSTLNSGDIGLDGYFKGGDSWTELTDWANDPTRSGFSKPATMKGPSQQYFDYAAPAYYHQFADFLSREDSTGYAWNICQFRRAEASSDWLMGQLYQGNPQNIPFAGHVSLSSTNAATFANFNEGEDFRLGWRTILNYVWHGNPAATWDPVAHQVTADAPNTFERDIGQRYASFLWDNRQAPWNNSCVISNSSLSKYTYWGPSVLQAGWKVDGSLGNYPFFLNWIHGTGSPSAIVSQDFNLMAEMYRQCEIEWDVETVGDGYLTSIPMYYHGWFRLLGMLVLSGNYHAASAIKPAANMKVYLDVDKTCAAKGDTVTYIIDYRNYGSVDAQNVVIVDTLDNDLSLVSGSGTATYQASTRAVTWAIGTVPGFKTTTGVAPTTGKLLLKVSVNEPTKKQYVNKVSVSCGNGTGWTSNEYPNSISSVMKRNLVDIIASSSLQGQNVSVASPLHGGRPGVHFSYSYSGAKASASQTMRIRIFHDAQEPYINYGNYRVSYFLYDSVRTGIGGTNGWSVQPLFVEGIEKLTVTHENLSPGSDSLGKWNQRFIFRFSDTTTTGSPDTNKNALATTTRHLECYVGIRNRIHRGGVDPLRVIWSIAPSNWQTLQWDDDWSWDSAVSGVDADPGYPITPDFTDPSPTAIVSAVKTLNPKHCDTATKSVDNILVEEWDGYSWRRVFGNACGSLVTPLQSAAILNRAASMLLYAHSTIRYTLPASAQVRIQILDMRGRSLATVVDAYQKAGAHSVRWDSKKTGSNVYCLRLQSGKISLLKKVISVQ